MAGAPKMGESRKRLLGFNLQQNCKLRQKQMRYLLENMKGPDFSLITSTRALSNSFDIDDEGLNEAGITYRILNSQGFGRGRHESNTPPSYGSVANFMAGIQDYLPANLRSKQNPYRLWSYRSFQSDTQTIAEETRELLDDMCDWLVMMKTKIEDYIASHYFREGKLNHLEVLKRRYKDEWSERTEQQIDADVKADNEIKIVIDDYEATDGTSL